MLTLGLFGRAQRAAALYGALYVPCGPFPHLICALRLFSTLYMHPAALSDPLYMPPAALSVHVSAFVCCVCVSVSRLKGF